MPASQPDRSTAPRIVPDPALVGWKLKTAGQKMLGVASADFRKVVGSGYF